MHVDVPIRLSTPDGLELLELRAFSSEAADCAVKRR
jgi:hypothetical protein